MERFVQLIASGELVLVAGLWMAALFDAWSIVWLLGGALVLFGTGSVLAGIAVEIDI